MRRRPATAMTQSEFVRAVDGFGLEFEDIAALANRSVRAIKSYYYGERSVAPTVALAVASLVSDRAAVGLSNQAKEPWWLQVMGRFAAVAQSDMEAERKELRASVDAMCRSCEPQGICRTEDCPLRPVSPLRFIRRRAA